MRVPAASGKAQCFLFFYIMRKAFEINGIILPTVKEIRTLKNSALDQVLKKIDVHLKSLPVASWNNNKLIVYKQNLYNKKRIIRLEKAKRIDTTDFKTRVLMIQNSNCSICGCKEKSKLQIDHIIPVSKGGSDGLDNLQVLCYKCNYKKKDKIYG